MYFILVFSVIINTDVRFQRVYMHTQLYRDWTEHLRNCTKPLVRAFSYYLPQDMPILQALA